METLTTLKKYNTKKITEKQLKKMTVGGFLILFIASNASRVAKFEEFEFFRYEVETDEVVLQRTDDLEMFKISKRSFLDTFSFV